MIRQLSRFFTRFSSKKHLLLVGLLLLLVIVIVLPAAKLDLETKTNAPQPTGWYLFLEPSDLYIKINKMTEEARSFYVFYLLTIDLIFPVIYSTFFSMVLERMRKTILPSITMKRTLLPLLLIAINLLENAGLIYFLMSNSDSFSLLTITLWSINIIKWLLLLIIGFDLLHGFGIILFAFIRKYKREHPLH